MSNCRCEPNLQGLAVLAENPAVIITAYLSVVFPWGIMQTVDFISEKWRTVRYTRHHGYFHLALSIIPLPYIIFYAHLQQISSDYKEMMAAVVVILMAIYHIFQTVGGLMQLDAYHRWCVDLMQRMLELKMVREYEWITMIRSAEPGVLEKIKRKFAFIPEIKSSSTENRMKQLKGTNDLVGPGGAEQVIDNLDRLLKVNNEIVDNELGGTDLGVFVNWNEVG